MDMASLTALILDNNARAAQHGYNWMVANAATEKSKISRFKTVETFIFTLTKDDADSSLQRMTTTSAHQKLEQHAAVLDWTEESRALQHAFYTQLPTFANLALKTHIQFSLKNWQHEPPKIQTFIGQYRLQRALNSPKNRTNLDTIFAFIAQMPQPTDRYEIGNKTLRAASPEHALAVHVAMGAPSTPPHKRKVPKNIPAIRRVWEGPSLAACVDLVPAILSKT